MKYKPILFATLIFTTLFSVVHARTGAGQGGPLSVRNFNPDLSVIIDAIAHGHDGHGSLHHELGELRGFGHAHGGDHDHHHGHAHGFDKGFNLRHLEIIFQAAIDPYFTGWAIAAISEHGAEKEEAVVQTTCLPGRLAGEAGQVLQRLQPSERPACPRMELYRRAAGQNRLTYTRKKSKYKDFPKPFQKTGPTTAVIPRPVRPCFQCAEHRKKGDDMKEKTRRNSYEAFIGEAKAYFRLLAFAEKAEEEEIPQIALLFRAVAEGERVHATRHLSLLKDIIVKDTDANLEKAFQNETTVSETIYPDFIRDAEEEGETAAALTFSQARDAESYHAKLYERAIYDVIKEKVGTYRVCQVCGYVVSKKAPAKCPICSAPREKFKTIGEARTDAPSDDVSGNADKS